MDDISKLKLYLNDKDGSKFSPEELQMLLEEADCIYCAVAEGWSLLATRLDLEGTKRYTIGTETYEKDGIDNQIKAALRNSEYFKEKCTAKTHNGSFILKVSPKVES